MHGAHLLARPMTLGVRAAVFDADERIFLVRHTYVSGWYLPGGGVDPGETAAEAICRELLEEGNVELDEPPTLVSVYFNRAASNRDHVLLYRSGGFRRSALKMPDREIAETGFFDLDDLPEGTTEATRRRLDELAGRQPIDPYW
ncbi:NUDIX domain-containing protein [Jiella sp. KSK16Y-1]|uniref:NUDIX domain-containing protein n=2 Tax=Jiella mangrovi TaxID=2821407 RepID=A0ABS4BMQ1_9HYPH|nr:NUDIX domain-containing protein [Jiella mangrovi]MBP0617998.1 NUDIX domain-containing protein [Jiella mangrovi]